MCLITFAWNPTPRLRLLMVANRDEFHARPSAPLAAWAEQPDLIAGRDIEAQGNQTVASNILGINRNTLRKKMQLHKIK